MSSVSLSIPQPELIHILDETAPGQPLFPELEQARSDVDVLWNKPAARQILAAARDRMGDLYPLPQTLYALYREFRRTGARRSYERPYFEKRGSLTAAALSLFCGQQDALDPVQDILWSICEESNWVVPAHEWVAVDLFASETGFQLAETLSLLDGILCDEIVARVRAEIERRILAPYLAHHDDYRWYEGHNNWNGVCNGAVGSTFLLLERDPERLARALTLVLDGLEVFLDTAFEADGSSTEGVGYWQYGLMNVVCFSEMLRQRTQGQVDILSSVDKLRFVALYPLKVMTSPGHFANFSDSDERSSFHPGIVTRLAERTEQPEATQLLTGAGAQTGLPRRLCTALRTMLWWDGAQPEHVDLDDVHLSSAGVVRMVAQTPDGTPVVVAFKAGHNAENHNQNDVGTFVVHADGETLLCDPGRGLYSRQYFGDTRYENIFANSYGHSVPVIDGALQAAGRDYAGRVLAFAPDQDRKEISAEIGGAYPAEGLQSVQRTLYLAAAGPDAGTVVLSDAFTFGTDPSGIQEALVTWLTASIDGNTALIQGKRHDLRLTIEAPASARFTLESLQEACQANAKTDVLKRIAIDLPPRRSVAVRVRMELRRR